ncbi:hypothetical protein [Sorangium sp. So ce131]|uniref:hypothetical protein n=1 Tax=Sorangium sp. So ce131 TaxID=3133282 RepID=UPI003F60F93D
MDERESVFCETVRLVLETVGRCVDVDEVTRWSADERREAFDWALELRPVPIFPVPMNEPARVRALDRNALVQVECVVEILRDCVPRVRAVHPDAGECLEAFLEGAREGLAAFRFWAALFRQPRAAAVGRSCCERRPCGVEASAAAPASRPA